MARCPNCSRDAPQDSRFCPECGTSFASAATRTSASGEAPTAASGVVSHPSLDQSRFLPGAMLDGRYRIHGLLGRGGMGEVYRADDLKLGQPVALKFLPRELDDDRGRLSRFLTEVKLARQVSHPNVCRVYDVGEAGGQHYLSMEYVDGEDLASLLRRIGRLPKDKAAQIARQICAGLFAAHEQGILHRDLKPANVMIDGQGRAKITDFGLAGLEEALALGCLAFVIVATVLLAMLSERTSMLGYVSLDKPPQVLADRAEQIPLRSSRAWPGSSSIRRAG
jgi:serine/threonine protein kinase